MHEGRQDRIDDDADGIAGQAAQISIFARVPGVVLCSSWGRRGKESASLSKGGFAMKRGLLLLAMAFGLVALSAILTPVALYLRIG